MNKLLIALYADVLPKNAVAAEMQTTNTSEPDDILK